MRSSDSLSAMDGAILGPVGSHLFPLQLPVEGHLAVFIR